MKMKTLNQSPSERSFELKENHVPLRFSRKRSLSDNGKEDNRFEVNGHLENKNTGSHFTFKVGKKSVKIKLKGSFRNKQKSHRRTSDGCIREYPKWKLSSPNTLPIETTSKHSLSSLENEIGEVIADANLSELNQDSNEENESVSESNEVSIRNHSQIPQLPPMPKIPVNWLQRRKFTSAPSDDSGQSDAKTLKTLGLIERFDYILSQIELSKKSYREDNLAVIKILEEINYKAEVRFTIEILILSSLLFETFSIIPWEVRSFALILNIIGFGARLYNLNRDFKLKNSKNADNENDNGASTIPPSEVKSKTTVNEDTINSHIGMQFNFLEGSNLSFSDHFAKLSKSEQETFSQFKEEFLKEFDQCTTFDRNKYFDIPDDFNILRFLQADKYNMKLATKRLITNVSWRQANRIETLPTNPPPELSEYRRLRARAIVGRDKLERPVVIERIGKFFGSSQVPKALSMAQWLRCYCYETAEIFKDFREASIQNNRVIHRFTYIGDMKGLKFSSIRKISFLVTLKDEVEVHYPEISGPIILINAPSFLARTWSVISKVLDPVVAAKISIHSSIPETLFQDMFSEDIIPIEYGGKNRISF